MWDLRSIMTQIKYFCRFGKRIWPQTSSSFWNILNALIVYLWLHLCILLSYINLSFITLRILLLHFIYIHFTSLTRFIGHDLLLSLFIIYMRDWVLKVDFFAVNLWYTATGWPVMGGSVIIVQDRYSKSECFCLLTPEITIVITNRPKLNDFVIRKRVSEPIVLHLRFVFLVSSIRETRNRPIERIACVNTQ